MRPRPGLKSLQRLRRGRVDAEERHLAQEVRRAHLAAEGARSAEAELARERATLAQALAEETERVVKGQARVADLERSADFDRGQRLIQAEQALRLERARRGEQSARTAQARAEQALATAEAEAKALDRHCSRVEQSEARKIENEADEAALEVFAHRRHRGRR